ncbi:FAD binding domain-containing protein [Caballeronia sordidicola]|uniref:Periplasmic aromatic aldehyde oxidoreductase, FAD binding subunit YagS n=1 Tax=Caballeronia sordidicola TaxID=196367 RepID=A0A242M6W2_CABSO|nr:xanthine dehydrogenase family protein subunit M [Caballeronia sordidicola]OTP66573.1 Periplasmic aromatic aldehyde oxidoreductase, FAD binding subunit YagS [Caballeronia sordidicola]
MIRFDYTRPDNLQDAIREGRPDHAAFLAGGTNLVDLMKENVARPLELVDINRLPLHGISELEGGGLRLGALLTNSETAYDGRVQARFPMLASAILAGASPQLRNAATNGGNLNQRTRCYYFYDVDTPCNKRAPGQGCGAIGGFNRIHAIQGASDQCIATHPSDMCVSLAALEAKVQVSGPDGERTIEFEDYHRLPGDEPWRDNTLRPGELVTAIDLPAQGFAANHTYLKLRDRRSYAFALVSIAIGLRLQDGRVAEARIAMGGVAHKPWRRREAEELLVGREPSDAAFGEAADALLAGAVGRPTNTFKIELGRRGIVRALGQAAAGTPQSQTDKRIA